MEKKCIILAALVGLFVFILSMCLFLPNIFESSERILTKKDTFILQKIDNAICKKSFPFEIKTYETASMAYDNPIKVQKIGDKVNLHFSYVLGEKLTNFSGNILLFEKNEQYSKADCIHNYYKTGDIEVWQVELPDGRKDADFDTYVYEQTYSYISDEYFAIRVYN